MKETAMTQETIRPSLPTPAWLSRARHRLTTLGLPPEWSEDTVGAPSPRASKSADCLLRRLAEIDLEPSWLAPCLEGGVSIAFALENRYADIQFLNNGEIVTTLSGQSSQVSEVRAALHSIRTFLFG
jgi:hypothetical protein